MRNLFFHVVMAAIVALTTSGIATAAPTVELALSPDPPEAGANTLTIVLTEDGKPAPELVPSVLFYMPAMGSMPRMESRGQLQALGDGKHVAEFELSMGGTWEIELSLEGKAGAGRRVYRYSLTTGIPGITDKNPKSGDTPAASDKAVMDVGVERLQKNGVRFAEAKVESMTRTIRAVGLVEQDKTHREDVTLRVSGYVVKQFRGRVGDKVKPGEPLFSVYSPELVAAQSEFLLSQKFAEGPHAIHESTAERLRNLGLSNSDIAAIKASGATRRDVAIRSPIAGTILEINAREGAAVDAGRPLYVIGDLSKIYLVARVFQQDLGELRVGQPVDVLLPGAAERPYQGVIDLVYPQVEAGSGTGNVRVELKEFVSSLTPGTYADLRFTVPLGERLTIPAEAVLYSGLHNYVFVDRGEGRLEPIEVVLGKRVEGLVEIRDGLKAGDRVAASGTFLLSSEAQLRSALPKWSEAKP